MNYSQALDEQVRWIRWTRETLRNNRRSSNVDKIQEAILGLETGDTYYWSSEIVKAVITAGLEFPTSWVLDEDSIPTPRGFCFFDQRFATAFKTPEEIPVIVEAISWISVIDGVTGQKGVQVMAFTNSPVESGTRMTLFFWGYGEHARDVLEKIGENARIDQYGARAIEGLISAAVFGSSIAFLQQRIFTPVLHQAERHTRRRLVREGYQHEPVIRVVELRRKYAPSASTSDSEDKEWSCRWLVGAHWALRWVGQGRSEQRRVWIMPYVKGPEDKPLKPPRAKVFAVVR